MVVIADGSKRVAELGVAKLPVEVLPFARALVERRLLEIADAVTLRQSDDGPYRTDSGNLILDCTGWRRDSPEAVAARLDALPGVVGHGLFLTEVDAAYIATGGIVTRLERDASERVIPHGSSGNLASSPARSHAMNQIEDCMTDTATAARRQRTRSCTRTAA